VEKQFNHLQQEKEKSKENLKEKGKYIMSIDDNGKSRKKKKSK
jgi:hypothetical protein